MLDWLDQIFSPITYSITDITGTEAFPVWNSLNDGKYLKFDVSSNATTTWTFNITNLQIPCDRKLRIDYLVVGGGGSSQGINNEAPVLSAGKGGAGGGGDGAESKWPSPSSPTAGSTKGSPATYYGGGGGSVYFNPYTFLEGGAGYRGVVILKFYNQSV
jgi:hypothetical protein